MSTTIMDLTAAQVTAAPELGEVLPPRKVRGKVGMFIHRHPTIFVGGLLLFIILCIGVFAPFLGTVDPTALAPARRTRPPPDIFAWSEYWLGMGAKPPAVQFLFGSDMLGRDVYSRVLYGTQISLLVGFSVAVVASVIGMFIGLTSGFIRAVDTVVMRVMDGLQSIPGILLAIALMALTRASVQNVIAAIAVTQIPPVARLVRSVVLSLREQLETAWEQNIAYQEIMAELRKTLDARQHYIEQLELACQGHIARIAIVEEAASERLKALTAVSAELERANIKRQEILRHPIRAFLKSYRKSA